MNTVKGGHHYDQISRNPSPERLRIQSATDYAARMVRYGYLTREKAIQLVKEHDGNLDPLCVKDFCEFCGYTETEFWKIIDSLCNQELLKNDYGKWVLKHPVWENYD